MDKLTVQNPIEQRIYGAKNHLIGIYDLQLVQKRSMSLRDYKNKVDREAFMRSETDPYAVEQYVY